MGKIKQPSKRITLILSFLTIVGFVLGCNSPSVPQAVSRSAVKEVPPPAPFQTSALTINPAEANAGVQVMVTARVTNTSNANNTYTPKLRIDNVSQASLPSFLYLRDVSIPPGATQLLSFVIPTDNPGTYKVTWDKVTGEFVVVEPTATESSNFTATAPDFTGVDVVTGKKISLSQFKGQVVLFNFVNYGCDPSVNNVVSAQLLGIRELQKQRKDFVPVSVFCGCCPPEVLRDFAKQNNLSWPWILDTDNSIAGKYVKYLRKYGYPTLVFIDQNQQVREVAGYTTVPALSAKINKIVEQSN